MSAEDEKDQLGKRQEGGRPVLHITAAEHKDHQLCKLQLNGFMGIE